MKADQNLEFATAPLKNNSVIFEAKTE